MSERADLFQTVEAVRSRDHGELDGTLVREILTLQVEMQQDRADARKRTEQIVARWATDHAETPADDGS